VAIPRGTRRFFLPEINGSEPSDLQTAIPLYEKNACINGYKKRKGLLPVLTP
jgi:hypothetical protein